MKRLAQINVACNGSTGRLMGEIQEFASQEGYETISFYGRRNVKNKGNCVKFGSEISFCLDVLFTFVTDRQGAIAVFQTRKLIQELEKFKPDIIHLHNIHGYYLNYKSFFEWLNNEFKGKIVWTLHDCWSFTGHCAHFTYAKCDKWKEGCYHCPQKTQYPFSYVIDNSKKQYQSKKYQFTGGNLDLIITTPSEWLKNLVQCSFLKKYPIKVINNWVDLKKFYPAEGKNVRLKYDIPVNKKILLGVANPWSERKGLSFLQALSKDLSEEYCIVLVGITKRQKARLGRSVICIEKTELVNELVELYSEAFVLLNPSVEETFSLVTVEALACNTPAIVLGSSAPKELISDGINGFVLNKLSLVEFKKAIEKVKYLSTENNKIRNTALKYDKKLQINKFLEIYNNV